MLSLRLLVAVIGLVVRNVGVIGDQIVRVFGDVGIQVCRVFELSESGYGDIDVLFDVGELELLAGKIRNYSEGCYWGMPKRAVQVAYDVCAASIA